MESILHGKFSALVAICLARVDGRCDGTGRLD